MTARTNTTKSEAGEARRWTAAEARTVAAFAQAELNRRNAYLNAESRWNAAQIRESNGLWVETGFAAAAVLDNLAGHDGFGDAHEGLWQAVEALPYNPAMSAALARVKVAERASVIGLAA